MLPKNDEGTTCAKNSKRNQSYSDKLKSPKWQKKRLEIMSRDGFTCCKCGDEDTMLNVHHLSYSESPWDTENDQLITLCEDCHLLIEKAIKFQNMKVNDLIVKKMTTKAGSKIIIHNNDRGGISILTILKDQTIEYVAYDPQTASFIMQSIKNICTT